MNVRSTPGPILSRVLAATLFLLLSFSFLSVPAIAQSASSNERSQPVLIAQGADGVQNTDDDNTFSTEGEDVSWGRCTVSTNGGIAQALAFMICPIVEVILDSIDWAEKNIVVPYLSVNPMIAKDGEPLFELWKIVRNIANVGLIIGFMYLVFTQTTSFGGEAYAVKKMAPRLILVAIGIQLSFYISAFVVDIFNILGAGVGELTAGIIQQYGDGTVINISMQDYSDAGTGALLGLGAVAVARGIARGSMRLSPIFGFLVAAAITMVAVMLTLVLRQLVIASLVVVSPIAIAASLLPNTEKVFGTWRSWFTKALMMYPLIIGLFAMGKLFGVITSGFTPSGPEADGIASFLAFMANVVPLVVIPFTFRLAGGVIAGAMNFANTRAKTLQRDAGDANRGFGRNWNAVDNYRWRHYTAQDGQDGDGWKPKTARSAKLYARSGAAGRYYEKYRNRKGTPLLGIGRAAKQAGIMAYADATKDRRDMFNLAYTTPHSYEASAHFMKHWHKGRKGILAEAASLMSSDDPSQQQIGRNLQTMATGADDAFFVEAAAMHATSGSKTGTFGATTEFLNEAAKGFMYERGDGTWQFKNEQSFRQYDRLLQAVSKSGGRSMIHMGKIGAYQGNSWDTPIDFSTQDAFSWGGNTAGLQHLNNIADAEMRQDRKKNYGVLDAFGDIERYGMGQMNNNAAAGFLRAVSEDVHSGKFKGSFRPGEQDFQRADAAATYWGSMAVQSMNDKTKRKVMTNLHHVMEAVDAGHAIPRNDSYYSDLGPSALQYLTTRVPNGQGGSTTIAHKMFDMLSHAQGDYGSAADAAEWYAQQDAADHH